MKLARNEADAVVRGLGWLSIGLGATELLAPSTLGRRLGLPDRPGAVSAYGLREIVNGIGLLASRDPVPWLWGRVGGDAVDFATLAGAGLRRDNPRRGSVAGALLAVAGVAVLDVLAVVAVRGARRFPSRNFNYSGRSGLPRGLDAVRGAARDLRVPRDMRTPDAMRPWETS